MFSATYRVTANDFINPPISKFKMYALNLGIMGVGGGTTKNNQLKIIDQRSALVNMLARLLMWSFTALKRLLGEQLLFASALQTDVCNSRPRSFTSVCLG